jgi:K+/H+ antiporter YhaU regulatory subunit KhtT
MNPIPYTLATYNGEAVHVIYVRDGRAQVYYADDSEMTAFMVRAELLVFP